ncbi:Serine/threonine-protein kinase StkP [Pirellula sp. SH-Sr6A]|uniref:serine/threonine protein kinase n=1 Tax=Pirellula sp. SH-Sr6A TaxID=1632865 RepID=UPI00078D5C79|nr:serine/threonine-protein kinase [Pirellula sp. SH-Sr6A]AMV32095.1 Serine/threonine-protein kinase StkP [Pirellula sp. SH-Sr6A]
MQAVAAEQECLPFQPLSREPYRAHLFFGSDDSAFSDLQSFAHEIVGLSNELRRAVYGNKSEMGLSDLIYSAGDSIHGESEKIIDRWMSTIHWWAWKVSGSPIYTRPQVVFGKKGIPTDFMDPAVEDKLAFSWLDQNVFSCSVEVLKIFLKFMEVRPSGGYSSTYPFNVTIDNDAQESDSMRTVKLNGRTWSFFTDRQLGPRGGNGVVFEGRSESGSEVAVKRLRLSLTSSPEARELEIVENLVGQTHSHIIPVLDCGRDEDTRDGYVVMAKAEKSLADECKNGPLNVNEAVRILLEVGQGLKEVEHIVHRDIKPENILFHDGRWKLTDFGISRFVDAVTASETHKKKLSSRYASPEQWKEEKATHASDIYSLGCVAYFLITGHPPFSGPNREDFKQQHLSSTPPNIPIEDHRLATLIKMMMQKPAEARPTIDVVLSALQNCRDTPFLRKNIAIQRLAALAVKVENDKAESSGREMLKRGELENRIELGRHAYQQLKEIANDFFQEVIEAVPNIEQRKVRSGLVSLECTLGRGKLLIELDDSHIHPPSDFSVSGWDVVASGVIGVLQTLPEYRFWSSLWYAKPRVDAPGYRWYEVAYFTSPLVGKGKQFEPFHLTDDVKKADIAMSSVMGKICMAYEPLPIDSEAKTVFFQRWTDRFADAVQGSLARPPVLPIP